jgi:hypothetical protein
MGIIADHVAHGLPDPPPKPGIVDRILASLDDEDRAIVTGWLHDPDVAHVWIEARLNAAEYPVSDSEIGRWRRKNGAAWAA